MSPRYSVIKKLRTFEEESLLASFSVRMTRARKILRMTQAEMAREIDVSLSTLQQWEQGSKLPSLVLYFRAKKLFKRAEQKKEIASR